MSLDALLARWAEEPTPELRDAIIVKALGFVKAVARRYPSDPEAVPNGVVGLIEAFDAWDPKRGTHFLSYALNGVRRAILRMPRSGAIELTRHDREALAKISRAEARLPPDATDEDVAREAGTGLKTTARLRWDAALVQDMDPEEALGSYLDVDALIDAKRVRGLVASLPDRLREAITRKYLEGERADEAAREMGVTKQGFWHIEQRALRELRSRL